MKNLKKMNLFISTLILLTSLSGSICGQNTETKGTLLVTVKNIESNKGQIVVCLYRPNDNVRGNPFLKTETTINGDKAAASFNNLTYGNYVALAFHDKNNNQMLDHNFLGFPDEPFGYSNNWNFSVFSGMPTYEKTKFTFSKTNNSITITVK